MCVTILMLIFLSTLPMGCNHVFYYPDQTIRMTPQKIGLEFKQLKISSDSNNELVLWSIKSTREEQGVVLHFHGNAENMSSHFLYVHWLTLFGFRVLTFDYSGYGHSTGKPNREDLVKDGVTALSWASADAGKVPLFVVAQSLGGAVALPAIHLAKKPIAGLILESTFSSYRDIARKKLAQIWLTWPLQIPLSWLISRDFEPKDFASSIAFPTLVIHGDADPVVPLSEGRAVFSQLPPPYRKFWLAQGGGHTPVLATSNTSDRKKILSFLCEAGNIAPCPDQPALPSGYPPALSRTK